MRILTGEGILCAPPGTIAVALLLKLEVDPEGMVDFVFGFLGVFH